MPAAPDVPLDAPALETADDSQKEAAPSEPGQTEAASEPVQSAPQADTIRLEESDPRELFFTPEILDSTVIAIPLLKKLKRDREELKKNPARKPQLFPVIIDLNLKFPGGRDGARKWVLEATAKIIAQVGIDKDPNHQGINKLKSDFSQQYLFAVLEGDVIREMVKLDAEAKEEVKDTGIHSKIGTRAIYHVWPDFEIKRLTNQSISTVKADAAQSSFAAFGEDIVWAVLDSGIDISHPHFATHKNLDLQDPLSHMDFTQLNSSDPATALRDAFGHGTHVGGIIAGAMRVRNPGEVIQDDNPGVVEKIRAYMRLRDEEGEISYSEAKIRAISGMAPKCKLLSFKVLDDNGDGLASNLIVAIAKIQELNGHGRRLLVHGVNMSVGYDFEPEWFACGQSPLCVEVNRLVRSGVVVVVAAGNTGYGAAQSQFRGVISAGIDLTINDPGNADLAITVGSTHRTMPHIYGVSYFSSKGPTGDGRAKPDLVAPGEKILSCAAGKRLAEMREKGRECDYLEESGTSMAAPHVSGVIAAFLSIRREFIGYPEKVKEILLATATDLKRERYFQGYGLVDLMRAIQSV
ncbi:MAG: serine protease AprX [Blastocatellia bacterium]